MVHRPARSSRYSPGSSTKRRSSTGFTCRTRNGSIQIFQPLHAGYSPSSLISRDFKGREAKKSNPICKQITSTPTGDTSAGEMGSLPTPEQYNYISRGHRDTYGQVGPEGERKQRKMKIGATNGCPKICIFVGEATGISVPNGGEGWKNLIDFAFARDKQSHKSCAAEKLRKKGVSRITISGVLY